MTNSLSDSVKPSEHSYRASAICEIADPVGEGTGGKRLSSLSEPPSTIGGCPEILPRPKEGFVLRWPGGARPIYGVYVEVNLGSPPVCQADVRHLL